MNYFRNAHIYRNAHFGEDKITYDSACYMV